MRLCEIALTYDPDHVKAGRVQPPLGADMRRPSGRWVWYVFHVVKDPRLAVSGGLHQDVCFLPGRCTGLSVAARTQAAKKIPHVHENIGKHALADSSGCLLELLNAVHGNKFFQLEMIQHREIYTCGKRMQANLSKLLLSRRLGSIEDGGALSGFKAMRRMAHAFMALQRYEALGEVNGDDRSGCDSISKLCGYIPLKE